MNTNAGRLKVGVVTKAPMAALVWSVPRLSSSRKFVAAVPMFAALLFSSQLALAQFTQQGPKLVGTLAVGPADQGWSVSLSTDGNTAIVGGPYDNSQAGAAWIYTRSSGAWSQQGSKLVGTGAIAGSQPTQQGYSVAISGDGNTAIVGGPYDNTDVGAAWVYTRSGSSWTQQTKLVANDAIGPSVQGHSVALSSDGDTAIVGGPVDNGNTGAAWVYTRSGRSWTQQTKLVANNASAATQGWSVSLSADGNTAIVGGPYGNSQAGAAWVYTRSGTHWTQKAQLVGTGAVGDITLQGYSVALSGDGKTALVGGPGDNSQIGAAWAYALVSGAWNQQSKLVGTDAVGSAYQGYSVALSGNGGTAILGGPGDNSQIGATWVYTSGRFVPCCVVWTQQGNKLVGNSVTGAYSDQGWSVSLSSDGDTVLVGGPGDNIDDACACGVGAAWVFVQPLQVTPTTDIASSGTQGGPFSPSSFSYTMTATSGSVPYSIITPSWLTASPASGTVTTKQTVTFKINSSADTLAPSTYSDSIVFIDTSDGQAIGRAATLTVNAKLFKITVEASPAADGTVSGGGTFAEGSSQTVTATPNVGFQFNQWTKNGKVVSYSQSYTFALDANVTLVADFIKIGCVKYANKAGVGQSATPSFATGAAGLCSDSCRAG